MLRLLAGVECDPVSVLLGKELLYGLKKDTVSDAKESKVHCMIKRKLLEFVVNIIGSLFVRGLSGSSGNNEREYISILHIQCRVNA